MENSADIKNNTEKETCVFALLAFIHFAGWALFCLVFLIFILFSRTFGFSSGFLGGYAALIIFIIALVCAFSPLYLRIKRMWLKYLIMYAITAVFIIFLFVSIAAISNYYSDFTKEKWLEYPQFRSYMLEDLKENHGLIGMDGGGVIELLGTPDSKNETRFLYYVDKQNRTSMFIEIIFVDGNVSSATYYNVT